MKLEKTPAGPGWAGRNPALGAVGLPGGCLCGHAKPQPCVVEVCGGTGPLPQTWAPRPTGPGPLPQLEARVENPDRGRLRGRGNGPRGPRAGRCGAQGRRASGCPWRGFCSQSICRARARTCQAPHLLYLNLDQVGAQKPRLKERVTCPGPLS